MKYILTTIVASIVSIGSVMFSPQLPSDDFPKPVYPSTEGYVESETTTTVLVPKPRPVIIMTACEKVRELARIVG